MADRSFANRVVLPVTDATYRNGEEKPAMRWSFEMGIGAKVTRCCLILFFELEKDLVLQISVASYKHSEIQSDDQCKRLSSHSELSKGQSICG